MPTVFAFSIYIASSNISFIAITDIDESCFISSFLHTITPILKLLVKKFYQDF